MNKAKVDETKAADAKVDNAKAARRARAMAYFESVGIDPAVEPECQRASDAMVAGTEVTSVAWEHYRKMVGAGVTTLPCVIDILGVVFYSHVEVTFTDPAGTAHLFEGSAGGVGVGDITGAGVIYYADLETLVRTKSFGVAFVSEDGGTAMVTWGSHGNANIVGIGEGLGAFGGSGDWK